MKRSSAALAAALHWLLLESKRLKPDSEVVSVSSGESDTEVSSDGSGNRLNPLVEPTSAIRLFYAPSYNLHDTMAAKALQNNQDTVTIEELVGIRDLEETFQFNFSVDIPFFLGHLHPHFVRNKRRVTLVTGAQQLTALDTELQEILPHFNLHEVVASVPDRFGTHHTKMMVNFFENSECEVVIMTCNLTKLDFGGLTQMCWRSGRMKAGPTSKTSIGFRFQRDLTNYLQRYKKVSLNELAKRLSNFDFSAVNVELMASAPGHFDMDETTPNSEIYGYGKLRQILERNNLLISGLATHHNVLSQVSSIAYPVVSRQFRTASVLTHILCPLFLQKKFSILQPGSETTRQHQKSNNYTPAIIFPTATEISQANVGFGAGMSIHFNYTRSHAHENQYKQNIQPYLHKWGSKNDLAGRNYVPPHVKLYLCDNGDEWKTLKWALLTSHNLSKQAWGTPSSKDGRKYLVASYELGVLVPGLEILTPVYKLDRLKDCSAPLRVPFLLPPEPYTTMDQPWSPHLNFGDLSDRFGNQYRP